MTTVESDNIEIPPPFQVTEASSSFGLNSSKLPGNSGVLNSEPINAPEVD